MNPTLSTQSRVAVYGVPMSTPELCTVFTTFPSAEKAAEAAKTLVQERLIACANLIPQVRSIYTWKGELCDESEVLVVMKSMPQRFDALERRLKELHPYEVPEILQLDVQKAHGPYLQWVRAAVL
jgi:periplasmic divalent cation tolerance protein